MKLYFCVFTQHDIRTGRAIGKSCCVVEAESEETAREKAYEMCGGENSAFLFIDEIKPEKGFSYTVYKSSI